MNSRSPSEIAGIPSHKIDLTGNWWASWQTSKDGEEVMRGELRLWDNEILMGWYAALDGGVRSKGTMYFVLHPHGQQMAGRWVGLSYDGKIVTGWGAMAREGQEVKNVIAQLKEQGGLA